ncbi:MAG: hypothetical protein ACK4HD_11575, partial [Pannonibacter phragmitetus]
MFRLAHLSDPHLGPLPEPELLQLLSKRILGYVNWRRSRKKAMGGDYLAALIEDMLTAGTPDHIALTGDLVNIDVSAVKNGFFGDAGASYAVPPVTRQVEKLCRDGRRALWTG